MGKYEVQKWWRTHDRWLAFQEGWCLWEGTGSAIFPVVCLLLIGLEAVAVVLKWNCQVLAKLNSKRKNDRLKIFSAILMWDTTHRLRNVVLLLDCVQNLRVLIVEVVSNLLPFVRTESRPHVTSEPKMTFGLGTEQSSAAQQSSPFSFGMPPTVSKASFPLFMWNAIVVSFFQVLSWIMSLHKKRKFTGRICEEPSDVTKSGWQPDFWIYFQVRKSRKRYR